MPNTLSPAETTELLGLLEARFTQTDRFHPSVSWEAVKEKLLSAPAKLAALQAMESTGGEPNVVSDPQHPSAIVLMDCAAESPLGRRSLCYDEEARLSRKAHASENSAIRMAGEMGIQLLSETQYRALQSVADVDLKTSSWVLTPQEVRTRGGALFCDKRYGQVFMYHNGADSYYQSRGFRGFILL